MPSKSGELGVFLCAVGIRASRDKDFEFVEILDVRGNLLKGEVNRLRGVGGSLGLEDFVSATKLRDAMPLSARGGFLAEGLWVLEGVVQLVVGHSSWIPQVEFEGIKWRRPRKGDGWPKRLHVGRF